MSTPGNPDPNDTEESPIPDDDEDDGEDEPD